MQIDIPYSVVAGDAEVTSVKLYATSADGDDITDKLTSKYDISQPGSTIPPEVQSGGDEDKLIATCDLNTPGVATGDITDFLKTVNYPALTLNITAVIEVEGTVATINTDALGVTFYLKGDLTLTSSREDFLGDRYAYFSVDHHALHMTVDFTTGEAQLSPDTDSHSYKSEANDLTKPASSERQEVLGIWSDGSSGPYLAKYTVDFKVRSKGTLSSEGPIEYISAEVDIEGNIVPLFVTADGRLNLIDPVLTDADGRYEDQGEEGDSVHTQPSVRVSSTGCEVIRVYAYEEGYDPSSSDIYHKLEYQDDEPQNRASALLKDSQGRPVFVAIVPKDISIDSTRVDISTLYISDDSEYIDQYGTEKRSVVM